MKCVAGGYFPQQLRQTFHWKLNGKNVEFKKLSATADRRLLWAMN